MIMYLQSHSLINNGVIYSILCCPCLPQSPEAIDLSDAFLRRPVDTQLVPNSRREFSFNGPAYFLRAH